MTLFAGNSLDWQAYKSNYRAPFMLVSDSRRLVITNGRSYYRIDFKNDHVHAYICGQTFTDIVFGHSNTREDLLRWHDNLLHRLSQQAFAELIRN